MNGALKNRFAAAMAAVECGWKKVEGTRINVARVEEALKKDPRTIYVSCPYCLTISSNNINSNNNPVFHVSSMSRRLIRVFLGKDTELT